MKKLLGKQMKRVAMVVGVLMVCSHPASANLCEFDGAQVVANQDLDNMRGGFVTNSGLQISLGIIRAVGIDGVLQAISTVNIANTPQLSTQLAKLGFSTSNAQTTAEATAGITSQQADGATLVKNTGNLMIVQNSENNKLIQNTQIFNVVVENTRNVQRALNLSSSFRQQMMNMFR